MREKRKGERNEGAVVRHIDRRETIIVEACLEHLVFFVIHLNCSSPLPTSSCTLPSQEC
jgi:hypothetical protein